mmetsp:Transcript_15603/g.35830  ORF Transcript_15603/g.35830 Transcript_15603/m.35830 type:complete len:709 (-) Transcript_15603:72-2198(-)
MRAVPRRIGQLDARHATDIFKALVEKAPPTPAPGGYGVDSTAFAQALPWLRWKELVVCARHFGRRRAAVEEIAGQLAVELSERLDGSGGSSSSSSKGLQNPAAAADKELKVQGREVAAIVCSFAKLRPQSVEYGPIFKAVVEGARKRVWEFTRLDSMMLATALADVGMPMREIHEVLVLPVLRAIEGADEAGAAVTLDELRYLLHACSHTPQDWLLDANLEALSDATQSRLKIANFAQAVHIMMSWLRLASTKHAEVSTAALAAAALRLHHQRPMRPSHPLPTSLAPLMEALLAADPQSHRHPLKPPVVKVVVYALMQISRALHGTAAHKAEEIPSCLPAAAFIDGHPGPEVPARTPGAALDFRDWVQILSSVITFCNAHTHDRAAALVSTKSREDTLFDLPSYAGEALSFVAHRSLLRSDDTSVDVDSLLAFLYMLHTYRSLPPPTQEIYKHAATRVQALAHAGPALSPGELSKLGFLVEELVPLLPEAERGELTKRLMLDSLEMQASGVADREAGVNAAGLWRSAPRQFAGAPSLALKTTPGSRQASSERQEGLRCDAVLGGAQLWATLQTPIELQAVEEVSSMHQEELQEATAMATAPTAAELSKDGTPSVQASEVEELQATVRLLLDRIQTLEAKVAKQEVHVVEASKTPSTAQSSSGHQRMSGQLNRFPPTFNFEALRWTPMSNRFRYMRMRSLLPPTYATTW